MFFQGTLQEGINTALQEAKLVVCFVTGTALARILPQLSLYLSHPAGY
jgi:hypothetical protein